MCVYMYICICMCVHIMYPGGRPHKWLHKKCVRLSYICHTWFVAGTRASSRWCKCVKFGLCMICGRSSGLRHFVCDTTHSMCYILILYVTWLIPCVTRLSSICNLTQFYLWPDSFYVWHDSFYVCDTKHSTRDILICDILIPCVTRLILCVTWLILCVTWLILCVTCLILYTTWLNSMCDMPHSCLWFVAGTRAWSRRGVFGEGRWDCETDEQNRRCIGVLQVCRPEPWTWTLNLNPQT